MRADQLSGFGPIGTNRLDPLFKVGDRVQKVSGYKWPGEVVAVFKTRKGKDRYVVECTVPEVEGALHIYAEHQIAHAK